MNVIFGAPMAQYDQALGQVARLLGRSPVGRFLELRFLRDWVEPALRHGQAAFGFDTFAKPVAFVAWAALDTTARERWLRHPDELHESEWNEGTAAVITTAVMPGREAHAFCRAVRAELLSRYASLTVRRAGASPRVLYADR